MLATAYPSDLNVWQRRATDRLVSPIGDTFLTVVHLAVQTNVQAVLPSAFYEATTRPLAEIIPQLHSLPVDDMMLQDISTKFLLGREKLQQEGIKEVLAFLQPTFVRQNCQNGNDSATLMNAARTALVRLTDIEPYYNYCINNPAGVGMSLGVCSNCTNAIRLHIEGATLKIWEKLPSLFGLPDWEILTAEENTPESGDAA